MFLQKIRHLISHYIDVFYNKYYLPQILFQKKQRRRLINKKFSLLTGNCMGGYIYHQLGLKFSSPTINMMITNKDFVKIIFDQKYYMELNPIPYEDPEYPGVPSALLGDVVLHFTHYKNAEEGIDAWNTRKERIDYDNLYVIISDIDLTEEDIARLQNAPVKKIVVMTSKNYGFDHCLYLPVYEGQPHVGLLIGKTISGKWRFEKYFDFVKWLNSDDKVAQHFYIGK